MVDTLCEGLVDLGVREAFGVIGGAILPLHDALVRSRIDVRHFQHEGGAAYAAVEASLVADRPVLVFTTTGPGLTNALSGVVAARQEGAKVVLVTGHAQAEHRGRAPIQETSEQSFAGAGLFAPGPYFDVARAVEHPDELGVALRQLANAMDGDGGCVAHLSVPLSVQARSCRPAHVTVTSRALVPDPVALEAAAAALRDEPFAVWVGHGARRDAAAVRHFLEATGAPFMVTPRGKGVVDEGSPRYLGSTGLASTPGIGEALRELGIQRTLVLGTRLGEASCFYDPDLCPPGGLVHVDVDARVLGVAYPDEPLLGVRAQIGPMLAALEPLLVAGRDPSIALEAVPRVVPEPRVRPLDSRRVRPEFLLDTMQRVVVEGSDALVMAESGNAFCWTNSRLTFRAPGRYRCAGMFCPMGHVSAGAVGAALVRPERSTVALVGDGAFLMQNEINTAVKYGARVVWIVLNDSCLGMVDVGMQGLGYPKADLHFPPVDFAALARSLGADGVVVSAETDVEGALEAALKARSPFVVDVRIVEGIAAPLGGRNKSLGAQTEKQ